MLAWSMPRIKTCSTWNIDCKYLMISTCYVCYGISVNVSCCCDYSITVIKPCEITHNVDLTSDLCFSGMELAYLASL